MKHLILIPFLLFATAFASVDPYLWLEEVEGVKATAWMEKQNDITTNQLTLDPRFAGVEKYLKSVYSSKEKLNLGDIQGQFVYNFTSDNKNVRGRWQRTRISEYNKKITKWETVLDIDKLSVDENVKWVFKGANCLAPFYEVCLLKLSKGGKDAGVYREFNTRTKTFVANGFFLPEAKSSASWINKNTLLISSNFGRDSMTTSGYPREVRLMKRSQSLRSAKLLNKISKDYMGSWPMVVSDKVGTYKFIVNYPDFFTSEATFIDYNGVLNPLKLPKHIDLQTAYHGRVIFKIREDWTINGKTYTSGSLLSARIPNVISGGTKLIPSVIFKPTSTSSYDSVSTMSHSILVNSLENINGVVTQYALTSKSGQDIWTGRKLNLPSVSRTSISSTNSFNDLAYITFENFITPKSLYSFNGMTGDLKNLKGQKSWYKNSDYEINQKFAISKDGTKIPYFIVHKKNIVLDGNNPTLLYSYGGFNISLKPYYLSAKGKLLLENGGVFVIANIRGGGEFGPAWHKAALKEKRQNAYDDFYAVAEKLISTKVTSSKRLAIQGGSNGGLLVGVAMTQRPDLFKAVHCAVPLLDMMRYHKLLAGFSWTAEYGNPDIPLERAYIAKYSPYQNIFVDSKPPMVFFTTSTKDDRVHPGHARKMAHKMSDFGHDFLYYENPEGGHGGSVGVDQKAYLGAMQFIFFYKNIFD